MRKCGIDVVQLIPQQSSTLGHSDVVCLLVLDFAFRVHVFRELEASYTAPAAGTTTLKLLQSLPQVLSPKLSSASASASASSSYSGGSTRSFNSSSNRSITSFEAFFAVGTKRKRDELHRGAAMADTSTASGTTSASRTYDESRDITTSNGGSPAAKRMRAAAAMSSSLPHHRASEADSRSTGAATSCATSAIDANELAAMNNKHLRATESSTLVVEEPTTAPSASSPAGTTAVSSLVSLFLSTEEPEAPGDYALGFVPPSTGSAEFDVQRGASILCRVRTATHSLVSLSSHTSFERFLACSGDRTIPGLVLRAQHSIVPLYSIAVVTNR